MDPSDRTDDARDPEAQQHQTSRPPRPSHRNRNNGTAYSPPQYGETEAVDTLELREVLRELAEISQVQYDLERDAVAQELGIHVLTLDRMVERARRGEQKLSGSIAIDAFEERFVSPEYLVDGIIQTKYLYALTGHSNAGKTAIAAALTCAVDSGTAFAGAETLASPVLYLCGENVDDFRQRIMATYQEHWVHHPRKERRVHIIDHAFPIRKHFQFVLDECDRLGGVRLIVIDTSIAYSDYEEENANAQIAEHTRSCRKLTKALGDPAVLLLCHPPKNAPEEGLIPRGGGAMLNELDTNLTLWFDGETSKLHHTKIRGTPFNPLMFRFRQVELVGREDTKGRAITTVIAEPSEEGPRTRRGRPTKGMPDNARIAYKALEEVLESDGHQLADGTSVIPAKKRYVRVEVWRQQFNSRFGEKGNETDAASRVAWQRAKSFLIGHEIVKVWDDFVWSVL